MTGIFPGWRAAIASTEDADNIRHEWLKGLAQARVTAEQLEAGLAKARQHDSPFLPSVGQFLAWCRLGATGVAALPSETAARGELGRILAIPAEGRDWQALHPAIYWIYTRKSSLDWRQMTTTEFRQEFRDLYREAERKLAAGEALAAPLPKARRIEPDTGPAASRETVARSIADLRGMLADSENRNDNEDKQRGGL